MSFKADAVIIEPKSSHKRSVIWLHGLGADGHDFEPIVPELGLPKDLGIRFIFPNAPIRPVTINGGMAMRAWYDIKEANLRRSEDTESIDASKEIIFNYIRAEMESGLSASDIIVAGFSQGGAITLHAGTRFELALAGLIALSTYLPLPDRLADEAHSNNQSTPIFMGHGVGDPVIPLTQGRDSSNALKDAGYNVDWNEYMMDHAVCMEEIRQIGEWIQARFS